MLDGILTYQHERSIRILAPKCLREKLLYLAHSSLLNGGHFPLRKPRPNSSIGLGRTWQLKSTTLSTNVKCALPEDQEDNHQSLPNLSSRRRTTPVHEMLSRRPLWPTATNCQKNLSQVLLATSASTSSPCQYWAQKRVPSLTLCTSA